MPKSLVMKIVDVTKRYALGKNETVALQRINLEVRSGEYVMFYGPSGCGKSTLLNLIAGLERPTSGKVYIRGEDVAHLSKERLAELRRVAIGIVFQQFNLVHSLTALENVAMPLALGGVPRRQRELQAKELLESLGLAKHLFHFPQELSGGQQQRVAIARALIHRPFILLADEPTGNVDSKTAQEVMELFYSLNKKSKRTVLLVTHNPDYLHYADRVLTMRDGEVVKEDRRTPSPQQRQKLESDKEIASLLRRYTRMQLNDLAIRYGLHGESFKHRSAVAAAIVEAAGRHEEETSQRLKTILGAPESEAAGRHSGDNEADDEN